MIASKIKRLATLMSSFWVKHLSYREQPFINFKQQYFLYIETEDENYPIVCTTLLSNSEVAEQLNQCTSVKMNEMDNNGDGKLDELILEISVVTNPGQSVHTVYLLLIFDYILQHQCLLQMESAAVIESSTSVRASKLEIIGDLQLIQKTLLPCRGRDLRYNHSVLTPDNDIQIGRVIKESATRNVSTKLGNVYTIWTRGNQDTEFLLSAEIHYPEVEVHYRPGFWPVIKWAWMQYFSILVLFIGLSRWIKSYVFLNQLLPTVPYASWKKQV